MIWNKRLLSAYLRVLIISWFVLVGALSLASPQSKPIWEIGRDDRSAREFPPQPRPGLVYNASNGDWKKDWAATQTCGSPYDITFSLTTPSGGYVLRISEITYTPIVPTVSVDVNGHRGDFYLRPELVRSAMEPDPVRLAELSIDIPSAYLKAGANRVSLSCTEPSRRHTDKRNVSGIRYDYISLTKQTSREPARITASLRPTIFYRQREGQLLEVVNATVRFTGPEAAQKAVLKMNGRSFAAEVKPMADFGEQSIDFEVPEWTGVVTAQLTIGSSGESEFTFQVQPARKWKLFVVPHTHLDIGYTDYQGKVSEVQARTLQDVMAMVREHPEFRFATDGSWNVEQFMDTRSPDLQAKLAEVVKSGKIGVPANYANLLTGYSSLETLYRSLYYSRSLARTRGIPFDYASVTDVPSYTGAYPSILARAGIRYLVAAGNGDRGPVLQHEDWDLKSPFWWEGTGGGKVLFWYSRNYSQIESLFGLPPEIEGGQGALPPFLRRYSQENYAPDALLIYGAQSENTQIEARLGGFASEWNREYAFPEFRYATFADFLRYIDQRYASNLATYKGDFGPYWEDGIGADAANTKQDRLNQHRALSVDFLSTVAHAMGLGFHPPKAELDDAWRNIQLYSEHTWTGGMSVTQPHMQRVVDELAIKDNRAVQAKFQLDDVANRAMAHVTDQIHVPALTLVVFNGLNWKRNVLVETDLRKNERLVDIATGREIPAELLWRREGFTRARFLVTDIPPVGYKCVQFKVESDIPDDSRVDTQATVENQFYRVTVDPASGSIRSIFDKQLQRDIADEKSPYRFGQYVYVSGGHGGTTIVHPDPALPKPDLTVHPPQSGRYLGAKKTPWGHSIRLESSNTNTRSVQLEVLLFDSEKKIEFNYTVDKQYTEEKEGIYFAFPINLERPQFAYEIQQGWIDPAKNMMKGGSLEWFTVQHWMAAHDNGLAVAIVPVDAPLATFGDIVRGEWPGQFQPKSSTMLSYVMNNYWHTNYQAGQGGVLSFRYVLTSAKSFSPSAFSRLGWESMEPAELNRVIVPDKIGNPERPLPAMGTSFLDISGENVILAAWKLAEDGKGTIIRLQETAGSQSHVTVRSPLWPLRFATLTNAVEDDQRAIEVQSNSIQLTLNPYEVVTVRLQLGDAGQAK
ncbi:MAG TPA: glycoside hydrolase family 38 C-terminal domain-containing protein [Terriglobales bacterium]|nr:glycoside hydrolase family 38 C-terminal domain-containing protein [Terriglobales bacterium]